MFYWVVKYTLGMALKVVFRPWSRGRRNLPRRGPVILASNHLSFADHFFGPLPLPRKVVFLAKAEYFTRPGLTGLISRAFFNGTGQIPVDRTGGAASERALASGLRVLAGGNVLGIYPEGTRSRDGKLHKGKTGVARLALESRAPVVPCAMIGTFEFLPSGSFRPSLRIRPGVIFGGPLDFSRYHGQEADRAVLRAVTDEIMQAIQKLSGQEYVDTYARKSDGDAGSQGSLPGSPGPDEDGEPGDGAEGGPELLRRSPRPFTRYLALSPGPLRDWPRPLGLALCEWES